MVIFIDNEFRRCASLMIPQNWTHWPPVAVEEQGFQKQINMQGV